MFRRSFGSGFKLHALLLSHKYLLSYGHWEPCSEIVIMTKVREIGLVVHHPILGTHPLSGRLSIRRIASHRSARNVANRSPFVCPLNLIHNHYTHYTQSTIRAGSRDSRAASLPWATADRHPDPTHPWRERSDLLSAHYIVQWWTEDPNLSRDCSPII